MLTAALDDEVSSVSNVDIDGGYSTHAHCAPPRQSRGTAGDDVASRGVIMTSPSKLFAFLHHSQRQQPDTRSNADDDSTQAHDQAPGD